jgi:hypothetical protein
MNAEQFFRLVEKMRAKQREYFRTRSQAVLQESREYEQCIDAEIDRANKVLQEKIEPRIPFEG